MARRRKYQPLIVYLNGKLVGKLSRKTSGAIEFQYHETWLDWEHTLPVSLSLPLRETRYTGAPVTAVFDNLLPDSSNIRRRIAERVHAEGADAYSLLTELGRDCVGALQFLPEHEQPSAPGEVAGKPVTEREIAHIVRNLASAPLGLGDDDDFRISIAGAQEKTALLRWKGKWHKPLGTAATTHILKPQIGRLPNGIDLSFSVENEFFCQKLLAELSIPTANVAIETFEDQSVLIIERFDRLWTRDKRLLRLPQEDCCQALSVPPTLKYQADGGPGVQDILALLKGSDEPNADQTMFLRAQIAFWLLGATDGHAKNFSIFLTPSGRFRMTPLYDVLSAQPSADAGQIQRNKMKLAMSVGDSRHYGVDRIAPRHFEQTATRSKIEPTTVRRIFSELRADAPAALDRVLTNLPHGFPEQISQSISRGFRKRLEMLEYARSGPAGLRTAGSQ